MPDRLYLDTCAVVWLAEGSRRLRPSVKRRIDEADRVYVSGISAWEISLKVARGQLVLPVGPEEWFPAVVREHGLELSELTPGVMMAANRLPWHHRDPADRFIIADAQIKRSPVVTSDGLFNPYPVEVLF
ncbi:MAG: type II toxin-antitoxin system VapC family toxin [Puniceicoccaceae bacterium]